MDLRSYEDLLGFLENRENCMVLADAMKLDFALYYNIMYLLIERVTVKEPQHLLQAMQLLQNIGDGKGNNLALIMPPGYGKTKMIVYWIAWCLTRNPEVKFLYTNSVYAAVKDRGAEMVKVLCNVFTKRLFDIKPSRDARSSLLFRLDGAGSRSGYVGSAFKGGMIGLDAGNPNAPALDLNNRNITLDDPETHNIGNETINTFGGGLICDDLLDPKDIRSDACKQAMRDIYKGTLVNRLRGNNCKQIVLAQRLCVDDIFATIKEAEGEGVKKWDWCVVKALDKNDKSTWEEKMSTEELLAMRESYSMREIFQAQYMQEPIVPGGEIILEKWFKRHDGNIMHWNMLDMFITADTAAGRSDSGDWTVFCVWCVTNEGLFLLDMERGKWNVPEQIKRAVNLWNRWYYKHDEDGKLVAKRNTIYGLNDSPSKFYIEESSYGDGLISMLKTGGDTYGFIPVKELKPDKDKVMRVQDSTPWIEAGYVYLPSNRADITNTFLAECVKFTHTDKHEHDDIVDCLAYAVNLSLGKKFKYLFPTIRDSFNA